MSRWGRPRIWTPAPGSRGQAAASTVLPSERPEQQDHEAPHQEGRQDQEEASPGRGIDQRGLGAGRRFLLGLRGRSGCGGGIGHGEGSGGLEAHEQHPSPAGAFPLRRRPEPPAGWRVAHPRLAESGGMHDDSVGRWEDDVRASFLPCSISSTRLPPVENRSSRAGPSSVPSSTAVAQGMTLRTRSGARTPEGLRGGIRIASAGDDPPELPYLVPPVVRVGPFQLWEAASSRSRDRTARCGNAGPFRFHPWTYHPS